MAFPAGTIVADMVTKTVHGRRKNRFYYTSDTAPPDVDSVESIANAVFNKFANLFAAVMSDEVEVERCDARFYGSGSAQLEAPSNQAAVDGAIGADAVGGAVTSSPDTMPDEAALIIRVSTGKIGRSKRGRRFITGLSERVQNHGQIEPNHEIACVAIAGAVPQDITGVELSTGETTTLHARHYDRKNNVLEPIVKAWAIGTVGTRRDRRKSLTLDPITVSV